MCTCDLTKRFSSLIVKHHKPLRTCISLIVWNIIFILILIWIICGDAMYGIYRRSHSKNYKWYITLSMENDQKLFGQKCWSILNWCKFSTITNEMNVRLTWKMFISNWKVNFNAQSFANILKAMAHLTLEQRAMASAKSCRKWFKRRCNYKDIVYKMGVKKKRERETQYSGSILNPAKEL